MVLSQEDRAARIEIARDVLAALASKRIEATIGTYLNPEDDEYVAQYNRLHAARGTEAWEIEAEKQYQPPKKCSVCAIGAMFIAAVDRHNALKLRSASVEPQGSSMIAYLNQWFSSEEMRHIECGFEGEPIGVLSQEKAEQALAWHDQMVEDYYQNSREVCGHPEYIMVALMRNIIANGGEFKPETEEGVAGTEEEAWPDD